jgi:hypothetical protein
MPVALLIAGAAAAVALGAPAEPGFSKHTAIDIQAGTAVQIPSTNAPGTISRPDVINGVSCGAALGNGHVVWFTWKADQTGNFNVSTDGSNYDTVLYLLKGGKKIACNDDGSSSTTCDPLQALQCSLINFDVDRVGTRYYFAVAAFDGDAAGVTRLNLV